MIRGRILGAFAALVLSLSAGGCSGTDWDYWMSLPPLHIGERTPEPGTADNPAPEDQDQDMASAQPASAAPQALAPMPEASAGPLPPPPQQMASAAPSPSAVAHCRKIAQQRASDGALMGYDEETQATVYNGTYADCIAWNRKHGLQ